MSPKVLNLILKALDANGEAVFSREDLAAWPKGDFEEALRTGLLEEAAPAEEIVCPGCEEACLEDVEFVYGDRPEDTRAYVICGKREDVGRVPIPLEMLDRWAANKSRAEALRPARDTRQAAEETVSVRELLDDRALLVGALLEQHKHGQGTKRFVREAVTAESLAKALGWTPERVREVFVLLPGGSYEAYRRECERGAAHRCLSRFSRVRARPGKALTPAKWSVFWMTRAVTLLGLARESLVDIHRLLVARSATGLPNCGTFKKAVQRAAFRKNDKGEWERRCQSSSAAGPSLAQKEPAARPSRSVRLRQPARRATKGTAPAPKVCASCKDDFKPYECPVCDRLIADRCQDCHAEKKHGKMIP
jgi:hypothetical protein